MKRNIKNIDSRPRRVIAMALCSVLASVGIVAVSFGASRTALADGVPKGPGLDISGILNPGYDAWLGVYFIDGKEAYCGTVSKKPPLQLGQETLKANPRLNYLLTKYPAASASNEEAAAIGFLVHEAYDPDHRDAWDINQPYFPQAMRDAHSRLIAEADLQSGPYQVNPTIEMNANQRGGVVNGIQILAASHEAYVGPEITVELEGGATFNNGSTSIALSSRDVDQTSEFVMTANGLVTATARATVPGSDVIMADDGVSQQMYISAGPTEVVGNSPPTKGQATMQPRLSTQISQTEYQVGDSVADNVTFMPSQGELWLEDDGGKPATVSATCTLYGPFLTPQTQQGEVPADAPVLGSVNVVSQGPGTVRSEDVAAVTEPGYVTMVCAVDRSSQSEATRALITEPYWSAPYFEITESAVVKWPAAVTSKVKAPAVGVGVPNADNITLSGMPEDHATPLAVPGWAPDVAEVTHTSYLLPLAEVGNDIDAIPAQACTPDRAIESVRKPAVNGDVSVDLRALAPAEVPDFAFVTVVTTFEGDGRTQGFRSVCGDPTETYLVAPQAFLSTKASESVVVPGIASDIAIVGGTPPKGMTVASSAHYAEDSPTCDESFYTTPEVVVNGPGQYQLQGVNVTKRQDIYWVESGFWRGNLIAQGTCGNADEITKWAAKPVGLPRTGVSGDQMILLLAIGVSLVLVGAGIVLVRRRRSASDSG